jgi:peptidoglycan/xylan/chitin deacetylase (PgdA/CDA1 family)
MVFLPAANVVSLAEGLELLKEARSLKNTWVITFDDALFDFYTTAVPIIREFKYPVTMFVPTGMLGGKANWDSYDKSKSLMTWEQLEKCQQWNVSYGSHTVHHAVLTECEDSLIRDELTVSLHMLRDRLANVIPALAYPGGFHNLRVRQATKAAGYTCALGISSRWGNGAESDLMQLRRERFRH